MTHMILTGSFNIPPGRTLFSRLPLFFVFLVFLGAAVCTPAFAGMAVMTDSQLSQVEGGDLVQVDISNDYYGANNVTVIRFSSDVYVENYGELGSMRMGNYSRNATELGNLAQIYSSGNMIRNDVARNGTKPNFAVNNYQANFGLDTGPSYTRWDINWENVQMGVSEATPLQVYGVIIRAEFSNFGTPQQELRRLITGSNKLFGYSAARPLVTSGWLNSEMADLHPDASAITGNALFQLQRDCMMDQYWQLSSFNFNPNNANSSGSFREFYFNTDLNSVSPGDRTGNFVNQNHGFFISLDLTDRRFSGWNILGGVNEYQGWPNFEVGSNTTVAPIIPW